MALLIRNRRPVKLYVAIALYNPAQCANAGHYFVQAWYHIAPNSEAYVHGSTMGGPSFCTYGEWEDGGYTVGTRPIMVPNTVYQRCIGDVVIGARMYRFGEFAPVRPSNIVNMGP